MAFSTIEIDKKLRPCTCNFKKALFHMWAEKEIPILQITNMRLKAKALSRLERKMESGQIPPSTGGDNIVYVKTVVGIVEFEDGSVAEVEPQTIIFNDTAAIMNEYDFGERKE